MAQTKIRLGRYQVENMDSDLYIALGKNHWDPNSDTLTWVVTEKQLTWLLLQWPELTQLQNDFIQTIPYNP